MTLDELRAEMLKQRKQRNNIAVSVLSLIIGKIDTEIKNNKEVDVVAKIRKEISNNLETMKLAGERKDLLEENAYLESILPKPLTADEITTILGEIKPNNIGEAMKHLKSNYADRLDGALASKTVKAYLA